MCVRRVQAECFLRDDRAVNDPVSATATFLFTDIEGSTALVKQLRERYHEALADHHRILREAFAAYGGTEIDNQGDAFFVAFRRAREAVLAAADAQRALAKHDWPDGVSLRVRMGIHTGEAELAGERYVGLSVHRAARISALGQGGQVLVSQTTEHVLADEEERLPGLALRDLGVHRLKDLERPIRVYQLDIDGLPSTFAPLKASAPPPRRPWLRAAVAAAAVLVLGGATTAFLLARDGESAPEVVANSVVRIDPDTGKPVQVIPVGASPDLVVAAGGYVWTTHYILRDEGPEGLRNAGDRTLTRVDPRSGDAVVVGGGLAPCGLTTDPSGDVWVANCHQSGAVRTSDVVRVDADTLRFENTWPIPSTSGFYRGLAYGGGSLWVSGAEREEIYELDPDTGKRRSFAPEFSPGSTSAIGWADGYGDLWWTYFGAGTIARLKPERGAVKLVYGPLGFSPGSVVIDGDAVWVGDWNDDRVMRIDAARSRRMRIVPLRTQTGEAGVWMVAAAGEHAWATTPRDSAVWEIDSNTDAATRIPLAFPPAGVTTSGDDVWLTVRAPYRSARG